MIDIPDGCQKCTTCQELKLAISENFYFRDKKRGKFHAECKLCQNMRTKRYLEQHPLYWKNWYQSKSEEQKERVHAYYREHSEERRQARIQYGKAHQEEGRAYTRRYKKEHKEQYAALQRNRHALKQSAPGCHTAQDIQEQLRRQENKCYYCSARLSKVYHVDHVIPLSRGGSNDPSNLVIACPTCNISKHNKLLHEWPQGGRLL